MVHMRVHAVPTLGDVTKRIGLFVGSPLRNYGGQVHAGVIDQRTHAGITAANLEFTIPPEGPPGMPRPRRGAHHLDVPHMRRDCVQGRLKESRSVDPVVACSIAA